MWLFTTSGFFSVVLGDGKAGGLDPDAVMIRSRCREHLLQLQSRFASAIGGAKIATTSETDYPFRIVIDQVAWRSVMAGLAEELNYRNFKNQASSTQRAAGEQTDNGYSKLLGKIWAVVAEHYSSQRP